MITRYRVRLRNNYLDKLFDKDDNIVIYDIQYADPEYSFTIETPGSIDGGVVTKKYRQKASVTIVFALRLYDVAERNEACQRIKSWAAPGGELRTNDRPDQMLSHCVCEKYPEINSAKNWTEPLTMTFSSYLFPYWQDKTETVLTLTGSNVSGILDVPGNAPKSYVTAEIKPLYQYPDLGFIIRCGDSKIKVNNFTLVNSASSVVVDVDSRMNIRIREMLNGKAQQSLLSYRTGSSSDEFIAVCGQENSVSVESINNSPLTAKFTTRGAWI